MITNTQNIEFEKKMTIVIYTKHDCIFCSRAKILMNSRGIPFLEKIMGEDFSREWILTAYPTFKTLPIILDGQRVIGGYDDLVEEIAKNKYLGQTLLNEEESTYVRNF